MRIPCRVWIGVAGLVVSLSLVASAQTDTNEGLDDSDLIDRVLQIKDQRDQSFEKELAALKAQVGKLEQAAAKRQAAQGQAAQDQAGSKAVPAVAVSDNHWRFKYHQGRWWYWMPEEHWVYWSSSRWVRYSRPTAAARMLIERPASAGANSPPDGASH